MLQITLTQRFLNHWLWITYEYKGLKEGILFSHVHVCEHINEVLKYEY